ncbi:MAG TPA: outer membrane beta-barrel protein [Chthonomonadaceae bacterium]|nr:outer membrane beta-barrel protein [Chthonomonadaceae bacterium]
MSAWTIACMVSMILAPVIALCQASTGGAQNQGNQQTQPNQTTPAPQAPQTSQPVQPAQAPAPEWVFNGFTDWYYQVKFQKATASDVTGRQFDIKRDTFSMAVTEANISRAPTHKVPFGLTVTLTAGKNADIITSTDPGRPVKSLKLFQQLYATYDTFGHTPVTIDFGKFATWIGYEGIESINNDNYSRSFLYTFGQPIYHLGFRVSAPLTGRLTGTLYAVNGWNEVVDGNRGKSFGTTLAYVPTTPLTLTLNYYGGEEGSDRVNAAGSYGGIGFPNPGVLFVNLVDAYAVYQMTPKLKIGVDATYADASSTHVTGGHWNGQTLYARYQFTPVLAVAGRLDRFEDSNGLRSGVVDNYTSFTANLDYLAFHGHVLARLEYRHDHASTSYFSSGSGVGKNQDTITLATAYKF